MIAHVSVVVPAADEELLIGRCLRSLCRAVDELSAATGGRVGTDVVVVLDDCRDDTAGVVAGFPAVTTVTVAHHCVGMVRAAGCALATARAAVQGVPAAGHWLASTDADSVVPAGWLTRMVALADIAGADVVTGTIVPGPELTPIVREAWMSQHDARDGHGHVHGANLGVRASSLAELGGWRPMATGEDVDLVARAEDLAMTVVRSGAIAVHTSARSQSRVPLGFAGYLRDIIVDAGRQTSDDPGTEVTGAA